MNKTLFISLALLSASLTASAALPGDDKVVYSEAFNSAGALSSFVILDSNGDGNTWTYSSNDQAAICWGISSQANDDWLLTPEFNVEAGKVYKLMFTARAGGYDQTETLAVSYGEGTDPSAFTTLDRRLLISYQSITPYYIFTATKSGRVRIAWHDQAPIGSYAVTLDDISVRQVSTTGAPRAVSGLVATAAAGGAHQATISFTTPAWDNSGNKISSLTKVEIYRNSALVNTIDAPAVNTKLSWTDTGAANGNNTYTIVAYNAEGAGSPAQTTVTVGEDTPGKVSNVVLTSAGGTIHLSWSAPTAAVDGGYFNAAHCYYRVYLFKDYSYQLVTTTSRGVTSVSLNDNMEEQQQTRYAVAAVNDAGEGDKVQSNAALLGKAYTLPVRTDFSEEMDFMYTDGCTDSNGHYWWREEDDGYVRYSTNKMLWLFGGTASFNTGKLDFSHAQNPTLTFTDAPEEDTEFDVIAMLGDGSTTTLFTNTTVGKATHSIDLRSLKGKKDVVLKFQGSGGGYIGLYEVNIDDPTDYNLAVSMKAPERVFGAKVASIPVVVKNYGKKTATNYTVSLLADGKVVATTTVATALAASEAVSVPLAFTPAVNVTTVTLQAKVDFSNEEAPDDNVTKETTVSVVQSTQEKVTDLAATPSATGAVLSWTPVASTKESVTDNFESYPAFTLPGDGHYLEYEYNIGPWYNYDADKEYSLDIPGYSFPWEEEAFAFITFNADKVVADADSIQSAASLDVFKAHSGKQFLAAFSMKDDMAIGNKVSDWLISPRLSGDEQTVTFYVKALNSSNGTPTMQVAYSETDSLYDSFTQVLIDTVINMSTVDWAPISVTLPAGARYFAIHHTTPININQMLMIDDVTYERGNGTVLGYHVYRDGELIANTTAPTFTDTEGGTHSYNVTVLTNAGESQFSNTVEGTTGIVTPHTAVAMKDGPVFNLAGQRVARHYRGIVVKNGKKYLQK